MKFSEMILIILLILASVISQEIHKVNINIINKGVPIFIKI